MAKLQLRTLNAIYSLNAQSTLRTGKFRLFSNSRVNRRTRIRCDELETLLFALNIYCFISYFIFSISPLDLLLGY